MDSIVLTSIATFFVNNYSFYGSFMFLELCGVVNFGLKHTVLCTKKTVPQVQLHTAGWNRKKGPKKPVDFYGVLGHTRR